MIIGLDVGGTKALGLAVDHDGTVLGRARRPSAGTAEMLTATLATMIDDLRGADPDAVDGIGLGVAGLVTRDGTVRYSPNLPALLEFPLADRLAAAVGLPVVAANDATAGTWGEAKLGAGRAADDFAYVALGTGIGAGFVIDGRLLLGAHGFAGEVGHMTMDPHGPRHITGRHGPWEYYASGNALGRMGREAAEAGRLPGADALVDRIADLTGHHVVELMRSGDDDATAVFDGFCREAARGIADLVVAFDPERIVIGGGLVEIGPPLISGIDHWLGELLPGAAHRPRPAVVAAELGADAAALGAALLAAEA